MPVTVLFLGPLRDLAGAKTHEMPAPLGWSGLLEAVGEDVARELSNERVHIAHKGRVLAEKTALRALDGDEVALLPPVSGG